MIKRDKSEELEDRVWSLEYDINFFKKLCLGIVILIIIGTMIYAGYMVGYDTGVLDAKIEVLKIIKDQCLRQRIGS